MFQYSEGVCVPISGLYHFSFGQEVAYKHKHIVNTIKHTYTRIPTPSSCGFWYFVGVDLFFPFYSFFLEKFKSTSAVWNAHGSIKVYFMSKTSLQYQTCPEGTLLPLLRGVFSRLTEKIYEYGCKHTSLLLFLAYLSLFIDFYAHCGESDRKHV